jgi:hypothetical protein
MKKLLLVTAFGFVGLLTAPAYAESNFVVGTGTAAAKLDFRVVIPRILFLGVGTGATGTAIAANATVDRLTFDYSTNGQAIGSGVAAASVTNTGGFALNAIPVRVYGNNGQITLTSTNSGNLVNSVTAAETIPFTQITGATDLAALTPPVASGGTSAVTLNAGSTKVTSRTANWTFAYTNTVLPAAGQFDGTVTYTASMP